MRHKTYFDISKSRISHRLVYKRGVAEISDALTFILLMTSLVTGIILLALGLPRDNVNFPFIVLVVSPLIVSILLYAIFRKLCERRLVKVSTSFDKSQNTRLLLRFLEDNQYIFQRPAGDVIFAAEEEPTSFRRLWSEDLVFIIDDGQILFNVKKSFPTLNPPVLISHYLLKRKISRYLNGSDH